jgi:hypothetical protein
MINPLPLAQVKSHHPGDMVISILDKSPTSQQLTQPSKISPEFDTVEYSKPKSKNQMKVTPNCLSAIDFALNNNASCDLESSKHKSIFKVVRERSSTCVANSRLPFAKLFELKESLDKGFDEPKLKNMEVMSVGVMQPSPTLQTHS